MAEPGVPQASVGVGHFPLPLARVHGIGEAMKMPDNSTTTAYPRHAALGDRYFLKPVLFPNKDIPGADVRSPSGVTLPLRLEG